MYTMTDLFCGAGGTSQGAVVVPGLDVRMAANHDPLAIDSHQGNFPETDHDCADVSQVEPRRYPRTRILWASPECTNHSGAKGTKRAGQPGLWGDAPDHGAERSRATMWDVPRFAEVHHYDVVIVENVVEAARWVMWRPWLLAMDALGYEHRTVWLNSMHVPADLAPRAPQSRDRLYVVFWKRGIPAPDLEPRPLAPCDACGVDVPGVQVFKNGVRWGKYRSQYVYRCPNARCHDLVEPYVVPAAAAIDWTLPSQRIGDRAKPLRDKTLARIQRGLQEFASTPQLVPSGGTWNDSSTPLGTPMRARTTRETEGLLVPVEGREGKEARPSWATMRTQTARAETALVVPYHRTASATTTTQPLPTVTTVDRAAVAFIAELRGGGSFARDVRDPLSTISAGGNHHMLVRGGAPTANTDPNRTVPAVADCRFRMLAPTEIGLGMGFWPDYNVKGTKRQQVRQYGNAVTPCATEWLLRAVTASLN